MNPSNYIANNIIIIMYTSCERCCLICFFKFAFVFNAMLILLVLLFKMLGKFPENH